MKKIRSERRLSLHEISKHTKIQSKYLEYLENGEYEKLPADVYVKGFLKAYATFTGISEKILVKLYEREQGIRKNIKKINDQENFVEPLKLKKIVITPKVLIGALVVLFILSGFIYLYKEINTLIAEPRLAIVRPADGEIIEGNTVNVKGFTEKDSEVFINDQPVLVNDQGEFSENVGLQEGLNVIVARSKNKFDKESTRSISIRANTRESTQENVSENAENEAKQEKMFEMEVIVRPNPVWLSVEVDGTVVFSGTLLPEAVQKFQAREKFNITSGKGNNTHIKINGKDIGTLSDDPGIVRNVEFDIDTKY